MSDRERVVLAAVEHAVAEAADAWLNDARDYVAYRRLVEAVLARRAQLQPSLLGVSEQLSEPDAGDVAEQPELDDALADRHPVTPLSAGFDPDDAVGTLNRLRGAGSHDAQ